MSKKSRPGKKKAKQARKRRRAVAPKSELQKALARIRRQMLRERASGKSTPTNVRSTGTSRRSGTTQTVHTSGREDTYQDRRMTPERVQDAITRENQRRYWSEKPQDYQPVSSPEEVVEAVRRQQQEDDWSNDRR